jgi:hypothetical protein
MGMTSQQRGTFFGLYKKDGLIKQDNQQDENESQHQLKRNVVSQRNASPPERNHHPFQKSRSPSTERDHAESSVDQHPLNSVNGQKQDRRSMGMTSQQRGTFFGLYKKDNVNENHDQNKQPSVSNHISPTEKSRSSNTAGGHTENFQQDQLNNKQTVTSQQKGSFFGLYRKDGFDDIPHVMSINQNQTEITNDSAEIDRNSPEALQDILQKMYVRKMETLKSLQATREQYAHVNN